MIKRDLLETLMTLCLAEIKECDLLGKIPLKENTSTTEIGLG